MRILHLGDLHIGKKVNGYSMIEDQKHVFEQVYRLVDEKKIETVVIAGDIYDRSIPTEEATGLLDEFLSTLITDLQVRVVAVSGNHDSSTRLDFSSRILANQGLHIVGEYRKLVNRVSIGEADFYLMPYVDPSTIRRRYSDLLEERDLKISTYDDVMKFITDEIKDQMDRSRVNIGVYHGFVIGQGDDPSLIEKEDSVKVLSVGGKEAVMEDYFLDFDYTALGHLHGCRRVKDERVRYCGSPLRYSFSELKQKKRFLIVDVTKEGIEVDDTNIIEERYPMAEVKGTLKEVLEADIDKNAYLRVILTEQVLDAMNRLREKYTNVMELQFEVVTGKAKERRYTSTDIAKKRPDLLFGELAESVGVELTPEEKQVVEEVVDTLMKEEM